MSVDRNSWVFFAFALATQLGGCGVFSTVTSLRQAGGVKSDEACFDDNRDADIPHLPVNCDGWTEFPLDYEVTIFVDSQNGDDANINEAVPPVGGNTAIKAIKSLKKVNAVHTLSQYKAKSMRIVFKPGGSWPEADYIEVARSGTADHPLLFQGNDVLNADKAWRSGPRPKFVAGVRVRNNTPDHLAFSGLEFDGPGPGSNFGIAITRPGGFDYLIEDCLIKRYHHNLELMGGGYFGDPNVPPVGYVERHISGLKIRRNKLLYATGGGAAVSLAAQSFENTLVEENIFDLNGIDDLAMETLNNGYDHEQNFGDNTTQNNALAHDVYFLDRNAANHSVNVKFRNNLFSRTPLAIKGPSIGIMENNLFYNSVTPGFMGTHGGYTANNVYINSGTTLTGDNNGFYPNTDPNATERLANNLVKGNPGTPFAFKDDAPGIIRFDHNVIDGAGTAIQANFSATTCTRLEINSNEINSKNPYRFHESRNCQQVMTNNSYFSPNGPTSNLFLYSDQFYAVGSALHLGFADTVALYKSAGEQFVTAGFTHSDPTRDIVSYLRDRVTTVKPDRQTLLGYLNLVYAESRTNWHPELRVPNIITYIREGHDMQYMPIVDAP